MKVLPSARRKRIKQTEDLYNQIFNDITIYDEKIYQIINLLQDIQNKNEQELKKIKEIILTFISELKYLSQKEKNELKQKVIKIQIREVTKNLVLESLTDTIETVIKYTKEQYPSYNENVVINVDKVSYKEDDKNAFQRIDEWFKADIDTINLQYHILLIHFTETCYIIPRVIKIKLTNADTYVEIIPGRGCDRECCNDEYAIEEAYPEDEVELPPYHPNCTCEAVFYEKNELLQEDKDTV